MDENALTNLASVVVCVKNRANWVGDTLRSVVASQPREIIVVDDQSTDDTATVARQFTDKVIPSGGHGLAAARQLGAEQASSPYVVYVDSDAVLQDHCLAALIEALESQTEVGAAVASTVQLGPGTYWRNSMRKARSSIRSEIDDEPRYVESFPCTTVAIRRQIIVDVRFDPFFVGAAEDVDFSSRVFRAGWRIMRLPSALVYHKPRGSLLAFLKQQIWYGRGAERLYFKQASASAPSEPIGRRGNTHASLRRLTKEGRLSLLPAVIVSGAAFRLGMILERRALNGLSRSGKSH
jgi:glycosyltransferase involved in cell wall biosynthesis